MSIAVKKREWLQKLSYYCLSVIITVAIMLLGLAALHVDPFGSHNLAISDANLYVLGDVYFGRLLKGQENLLYTFNGIGSNNWASLAWGGFNPARFISALGTMESMPTLFTWISVANLALCGLTMYAMLAYLKGHRLDNLIFSTSYALMGFNVVNCYQTLFLIGPIMLPLMAMGLVKLLRGESPLAYILSFALCTFSNFYFGFMLAVASVAMCLAYLYVFRGAEGRCEHPVRTYAVSSFIGGLLPALMWLPALKAFSGGGRLDQTSASDFLFSENFPFVQMFSKLFTGANSTSELVSGMPNIFCGILVVALVVLYFMDKGADPRRKRAVAVLLAFYLVTFYVTAFTLAMHGGTHTNWFPYRYSFVFSFLLICVAAERFSRLDEVALGDCKRCGAAILVGVLVVFSTRYEFISGAYVLIDLGLLLLMWAGFYLYKTRPEQAPRRALNMLLILLVSGNLYANYALSIHAVQEWEMDESRYNMGVFVTGAMTEAISNSDPSFYRLEKDISETGTSGADSSLYDYNAVSGSGPTVRAFVHRQLSRLGINWFDMRHWYAAGVPGATDSLLGVKYVLSPYDLAAQKGYEEVLDFESVYAYRNPNALQVAVLSDAAAQEVELGSDAFRNLNAVWRAMSGAEEDVFEEEGDVAFTLHNVPETRVAGADELRRYSESKVAASASDSGSGGAPVTGPASTSVGAAGGAQPGKAYIDYEFTAAKDGPVYLYNTDIPDSANGASSEQVKLVGVYQAGESVTGRIPLNVDYATEEQFLESCSTVVFAYADNEALARMASVLRSRDISFEVDSPQEESRPHGAFTAEAGQRILFTIPWDEGWTCYIDGQQVPIDKTWDLFMSVEAPEGSHSYELRFFPAWMDYGLMISGAALLALVAYIAVWYHGNRKRRRAAAALQEDTMEKQEPSIPESSSVAADEKPGDGASAAAGETCPANETGETTVEGVQESGEPATTLPATASPPVAAPSRRAGEAQVPGLTQPSGQ